MLAKLHKTHGCHRNYLKPKSDINTSFGLNHFAGVVFYDTRGSYRSIPHEVFFCFLFLIICIVVLFIFIREMSRNEYELKILMFLDECWTSFYSSDKGKFKPANLCICERIKRLLVLRNNGNFHVIAQGSWIKIGILSAPI